MVPCTFMQIAALTKHDGKGQKHVLILQLTEPGNPFFLLVNQTSWVERERSDSDFNQTSCNFMKAHEILSMERFKGKEALYFYLPFHELRVYIMNMKTSALKDLTLLETMILDLQ